MPKTPRQPTDDLRRSLQDQKAPHMRDDAKRRMRSVLLAEAERVTFSGGERSKEQSSFFLTHMLRLRPVLTSVITVLVLAAAASASYYMYTERSSQVADTNTTHPIATTAGDFELTPDDLNSLGITTDATFTLSSQTPDASLTKDAILAGLTISPNVPYDLIENDAGDFVITPKASLTEGVVYVFSMATVDPVTLATSDEKTYSWAYEVQSPLRVTGTLPANESTSVGTSTGIEVSFTTENYTDFENHFVISPQVDGRFEYHRKTVVFIPNTLAPATIYTVTITAGLPVDGSDVTLADDVTFSFETDLREGGYVYSPSFENRYAEFLPTQTPVFAMYPGDASDTEEIPFAVYQYDTFDAFTAAADTFGNVPSWSQFSQTVTTVPTDGLTQVFEGSLPILSYEYQYYIELPDALDEGYYVAQMSPDDTIRQILVQVQPITAYESVSDTTTLLWTHDAETGTPLGGASYTVLGTDTTGTTDSDGLATFETPSIIQGDSIDRDQFITVTKDDHALLVPVTGSYYGDDWRYDTSSHDVDYWSYISSDRSLYLPDDTIHFWGVAQKRNGTQTDHLTVQLVQGSYDANGFGDLDDNTYHDTVFATTTVAPSERGMLTGSLDLTDVPPGYYTLKVLDGSTLVAQQEMNVETYTKPTYTIELIPEKRAVYEGEDVTYSIDTHFFDGTPVADLPVSYNGSLGSGTVTTGEDGLATLSFATEGRVQPYEDLNRASFWMGISPDVPEQGDMYASASVTAFTSSIILSGSGQTENGTGTVTMSAHAVDLDGINGNPDRYSWDVTGDPIGSLPVTLTATKITYNKVETGETYDFINKTTRKQYRYDRVETPAGETTLTTNDEGQISWSIPVGDEGYYEIQARATDPEDREARGAAYLWSGPYYGYGNYSNDELSIESSMDEPGSYDTRYSVDDAFDLSLMKENAVLPDSETPSYLLFTAQNGIQSAETSTSAKFPATFTEDDVPNIFVYGAYFNGAYYETTSTLLRFDETDRELTVDISLDKDTYAPGDDVTAAISVTNADGDPVRADVNVSAIDEAIAAISYGDPGSNPLTGLYAVVSARITNERSTHTEAVFLPTAEGGGCFIGETQVLMRDGTTKAISDIVAGDQVKTFASPGADEMTDARVVRTYHHSVDATLVINGTIETTSEHLFYVNGTWAPAGTIRIGDQLVGADGQTVRVTDLRTQSGMEDVYNLEIADVHTFIASGVYVHNEKGGGARNDFRDVAVYTTTETGRNGEAAVTFTLPDNITSWRMTTQAVTTDLEAGGAVSPIIVTKPFFTDVSVGRTYLAADSPTAVLRTFGGELSTNDPVTFTVSWVDHPELGSTELTGTVYDSVDYAFPDLPVGSYVLDVYAESGENGDTVQLPIDIVESRLTREDIAYLSIDDASSIVPSTVGRTEISLTNLESGQYYSVLKRLRWTPGDRIDQAVARSAAQQLLNAFYGESGIPETVDPITYTTEGGLGLLPYASSDPILTARSLEILRNAVDGPSTVNYLTMILNQADATDDEITAALYGMSLLDQPVLSEINIFIANRPDLSPNNVLTLALAVNALGAGEYSRTLLNGVLETYGETVDPYMRVEVSENIDDVARATIDAAILAVRLGDANARALWSYAKAHPPVDDLQVLEEITYIASAVPQLSADTVSVDVTVGGSTQTVMLTNNERHTLSLTADDIAGLSFTDATGAIGMTVVTTTALDPSTAALDPTVGVTKQYRVNNTPTTTYSRNDIVEIVLTPTISSSAPDDAYFIEDTLPSGLRLLTGPYIRYDTYAIYDDVAYPYRVDNQTVRFRSGQSSGTFRYFALVANPGTYVAESALIQGFNAPASMNLSPQSQQLTVE